jgi:hypothetical protein
MIGDNRLCVAQKYHRRRKAAPAVIDMSPAFIKGTAGSLPNATITFDKFHAVKIINDAVDQVRRTERKDHKLLVGTRYLWLRNPDHLSERQRVIFESLPMRHLKTARAYQIRLAFQELYEQSSSSGSTPGGNSCIRRCAIFEISATRCRRAANRHYPSSARPIPPRQVSADTDLGQNSALLPQPAPQPGKAASSRA